MTAATASYYGTPVSLVCLAPHTVVLVGGEAFGLLGRAKCFVGRRVRLEQTASFRADDRTAEYLIDRAGEGAQGEVLLTAIDSHGHARHVRVVTR